MAKSSKYASKETVAAAADRAETKPETVPVTTQTTTTEVTAAKGHVSALAFVAAGGTGLSNALAAYADAKQAETMGPLNMFCFFEFSMQEGDRNRIPVVGSKKGETGNDPYDRYTTEVTTKDGKKKVPGSWFTDVRNNTQACKDADQRIAWYDGDTEGMPEEIAKMGTGERAAKKKEVNNWKSYMRTALTKGAMLWQHAEMMGELNPDRVKVRMPFRLDKSDKGYTLYSSIIRLQDPSGELEDKSFTVSEFLALDPAKIPAGTEVTLASLEATKARKPRVKGAKVAGGKADYAVPATLEQFLSLLNIGSTAIDQSTDGGKMLTTKILAVCAAQGQASDDAVETLGDFLVSFEDTIWTVINAKYNKIKADKAAAQNIKAGRAVAA